MASEVVFYSSYTCPFAHRALLVLLEKEIAFKFVPIDVKAKTAEFIELYRKTTCADPSSDGKVPVLQHGEKLLAQSDLIAWYLAEEWNTGSQLIPKDAIQKAKMRKFVNEIPSKLLGAFVGFMKFESKSKQDQTKVLATFQAFLKHLESTIVLPYALGDQYTLADIMIYPWFQRMFVLERFFGVKLDEHPRLLQWRDNVKGREATKKAAKQTNQEMFLGIYEKLMK